MAIWKAAIPAGMTPPELLKFVRTWMKLDLSTHESNNPPNKPGGHCIHWHLNKTEAEIDSRFNEPAFPGKMNSAFDHDEAFVETLLIQAIVEHISDVYDWYVKPAPKPNLPIEVISNNFPVGKAVLKANRPTAFAVNNYKVVLSMIDKADPSVTHNGHSLFVLTAHPIP